jgi:hypothetical protein
VKPARVLAAVTEARSLLAAVRHEVVRDVGPVVVSGVLAEQLAKELAAGAAPGAVLVGDGASVAAGTEVLVHVIAGDPTDADEKLVQAAGAIGVDTVIVELWPQADWTRPFVLSPLVVECRAGEGFPVREIARRIVEGCQEGPVLAGRVPILKDAVRDELVTQAVSRSALIGLAGSRLGAARPLLTLEQGRLSSHLRTTTEEVTPSDDRTVLAAELAILLASGFGLRHVARAGRTVLPAPVVQAAVAAVGTWALAKALQAIESHLPTA